MSKYRTAFREYADFKKWDALTTGYILRHIFVAKCMKALGGDAKLVSDITHHKNPDMIVQHYYVYARLNLQEVSKEYNDAENFVVTEPQEVKVDPQKEREILLTEEKALEASKLASVKKKKKVGLDTISFFTGMGLWRSMPSIWTGRYSWCIVPSFC